LTGERRNPIAADGEVGDYISSVITDNVGNPWRTTISRSNYPGQTYRTELPPDTVGGPRPSVDESFSASDRKANGRARHAGQQK